MMATNATLQLELLECIICKDTYNDPVDLNCGHNFCRQCIIEHALNQEQESYGSEKLTCPICRKSCGLSSAQLRVKPSNFTLKSIIDSMQINCKVSVTKCSKHNKDHIAYCDTCVDLKCVKCLTTSCKSDHVTEDLEALGKKLQQDIQLQLVKVSTHSNNQPDLSSVQTDMEKVHKIREQLSQEKDKVRRLLSTSRPKLDRNCSVCKGAVIVLVEINPNFTLYVIYFDKTKYS